MRLSEMAGAATAIIGVDGHIWVQCNWQEICVKFHRNHPELRKRCIESDCSLPIKFANNADGGVYRCANGLYEASAPIFVQGEIVANLFMGQFLQQAPDTAFFRKQAQRYSFDEENYLQALARVPIFPEEKIKPILAFFARSAALIGEIGYSRLKLKESNASLKESENRYRLVVENTGEGILILLNGQVVFANQKVVRNISLGQDFLPLVHHSDQNTVRDFFEQVLRTETTATLGSIRLGEKSAPPMWVHINASKVDWQSEPALLLHLFNVTAQKEAEEMLRRAQQERANTQKMEAVASLATSVAHDFNNFAQIIGTDVELLLAQESPDSPRYQKLREIEFAVNKSSELAQNLMLFREDAVGSLQVVDIKQVLEQVIRSLRPLMPELVAIELDLNSFCKVVKGDPVKLFQVFMNLLLNARDSMPDGGTIRISTEDVEIQTSEDSDRHPDLPCGRYILIRIIDEGHGVSDTDHMRLFEPFYTSKATRQGHGLGLTAAYTFVKNHSGSISCENNPDKGACFNVYLPAVRDVKPVIHLPVGGFETLLLVDDDSYILNRGKEYLHNYGYTVLEAMSGEEACEVYCANQERISLVIMDLVMPGMGGETCIEKLLELNPTLPVLVASANPNSMSIKNTAVRSRIKGFVSKPYIRGRLLLAIRKAL